MVCKNCKILIQTHHNYCPDCGAKIIRKRLTIRSLFSHFSEQFLNYDNKFFQTFISLFTKPEDVIVCYINGTRKKYVNVISYFAIAITIAGLQMYILNKFFPEFMDLSILAVDENAVEMQKNNLSFMQEYQSIIMMFYAPIYAMFSRLVFLKNKKFNYTEHLVIFMYIIAQISIVSAIISILISFFGTSLGVLALITLPMQIIYSAYCLKRIFNLNLMEIVLKTLVFLILLIVASILFTILFFGGLYLIEGKEGFIEYFKAYKPPKA